MNKKARSAKAAFTLVEMVVVMAIITILASMILPKVSGVRARAERLGCASNMRSIVRGMKLYEEDWEQSPVVDGSNGRSDGIQDTTLAIFGRLYYMEKSAEGDVRAGITNLRIYTCPASLTKPPSPGAKGYRKPLDVTAPKAGIDYGVVTTGNTLRYVDDPDRNAVLIELELNHGGRNVAFWDSTAAFYPAGSLPADYPQNVIAENGLVNAGDPGGAEAAAEIYEADQVIREVGLNAGDPLQT